MSRSRRIAVTLVAVGAVLAVAVSSGLAMRSHATTARLLQRLRKGDGVEGHRDLLREAHHERGQGHACVEAHAVARRHGHLGADPRRQDRYRREARQPLRTVQRRCTRSVSLSAVALASVVGGRARSSWRPRPADSSGALRRQSRARRTDQFRHRGGCRQGQGLAAATDVRAATIDGTSSTGPTWKGLAGSKVKLTGGGTLIATDSYLVGVITDPSTLKVAGYDAGLMAEVIRRGTLAGPGRGDRRLHQDAEVRRQASSMGRRLAILATTAALASGAVAVMNATATQAPLRTPW